ncbi:MAG TPA: hypothetical protein VKP61_15435 [Candidatus Acidoferrum sp.]|nr:hypothetical protein [Candidatus Acidoferrum sp.]
MQLTRSDLTTSENTLRESGIENQTLLTDEYTEEKALENRIRNLDKFVDSAYATLQRESMPGEPHRLDLANDLRVKIQASRNLFRVAKLLSEPARESMFSKVHDSLDDLEETVASELSVTMNDRG